METKTINRLKAVHQQVACGEDEFEYYNSFSLVYEQNTAFD